MHNEQILILSKWFFNFDNWWALIDSLTARIFASKGPLMEENILKVSWILPTSKQEKISNYLLLVVSKKISIELNLGIVYY